MSRLCSHCQEAEAADLPLAGCGDALICECCAIEAMHSFGWRLGGASVMTHQAAACKPAPSWLADVGLQTDPELLAALQAAAHAAHRNEA